MEYVKGDGTVTGEFQRTESIVLHTKNGENREAGVYQRVDNLDESGTSYFRIDEDQIREIAARDNVDHYLALKKITPTSLKKDMLSRKKLEGMICPRGREYRHSF